MTLGEPGRGSARRWFAVPLVLLLMPATACTAEPSASPAPAADEQPSPFADCAALLEPPTAAASPPSAIPPAASAGASSPSAVPPAASPSAPPASGAQDIARFKTAQPASGAGGAASTEAFIPDSASSTAPRALGPDIAAPTTPPAQSENAVSSHARRALGVGAAEPSARLALGVGAAEPSARLALGVGAAEPSARLALGVGAAEPSARRSLGSHAAEPSAFRSLGVDAAERRARLALGSDTAAPSAPPAGDESGLPDISLPCFTGGAAVRLADLKGPAVINLWASWCGPCRTELPVIQGLADRTQGRVHVLGVDVGDSRDAAASFAAGRDVSMPTLYDRDKQLLSALGRITLPITIFVDPAGQQYVHPTPVDVASVTALLREHTGVTVTP